MAFKVSELISAKEVTGGIEIICNADTRHVFKNGFIVSAKGAHVIELPEAGGSTLAERPPLLTLQLCSTCYVQWVGELVNTMNKLGPKR